MKLYDLHAEPKKLNHHDITDEYVPEIFWKKYENNLEELKKREDAIAKDVYYSLKYAKYIIKGPWPKGEAAIAKSGHFAFKYVEDNMKRSSDTSTNINARSVYKSNKYKELTGIDLNK